MTTYKLTTNTPDPVTGLDNSMLGWHFILGEALNVFEGAIFCQQLGWTWQIFPNPEKPTDQRMSMVKAMIAPNQPIHVVVDDTQWFALDGEYVRVLEDADVTANYTVTEYVPPAPAPPIQPPTELPPPQEETPAAPLPVVTGVSPNTGTVAGGDTVAISGSNFTGATTVTFGAIPAASFTVTNDTTISAVTPPAAQATVDISVGNPSGGSVPTPADQFTFTTP